MAWFGWLGLVWLVWFGWCGVGHDVSAFVFIVFFDVFFFLKRVPYSALSSSRSRGESLRVVWVWLSKYSFC